MSSFYPKLPYVIYHWSKLVNMVLWSVLERLTALYFIYEKDTYSFNLNNMRHWDRQLDWSVTFAWLALFQRLYLWWWNEVWTRFDTNNLFALLYSRLLFGCAVEEEFVVKINRNDFLIICHPVGCYQKVATNKTWWTSVPLDI